MTEPYQLCALTDGFLDRLDRAATTLHTAASTPSLQCRHNGSKKATLHIWNAQQIAKLCAEVRLAAIPDDLVVTIGNPSPAIDRLRASLARALAEESLLAAPDGTVSVSIADLQAVLAFARPLSLPSQEWFDRKTASDPDLDTEARSPDWRDDPIAVAAVSLAETLDTLELPKGSRLRGTKAGIEIAEPGKPPYLLEIIPDTPDGSAPSLTNCRHCGGPLETGPTGFTDCPACNPNPARG